MPARSRFAQTQLDFDAPIQAPAAPVQRRNRFAPLPDPSPLRQTPGLLERIGVDDLPTITAVVTPPAVGPEAALSEFFAAQEAYAAAVEERQAEIRAEAARREAESRRDVAIDKIYQRLLASSAFPVEPKRPARLISGAAPAALEMMERWEKWNTERENRLRVLRAQAEAMYAQSQSPVPAPVASLPPLPPIQRSRQR